MGDFYVNIFDLSSEACVVMCDGSFSLPAPPADIFHLASYLADILCDPIDHQHVHIICYSASGRGKSLVVIALAEMLSIELAARCGTTPEYHFTLDDIVVADVEKTNAKFLEAKNKRLKHHIIVIDESGIETNGRRAMSKGNVKAVKVGMIMRELGICVIRNVQNIELLDSGIRKQATHELSIETAKHQLGYNDCKFKIVVDKPGFKKNWTNYPTSPDGFTKYKRIRIGLPSLELLKEYLNLKGESTGNFFESELNEKEEESRVGRRSIEEVDSWCRKAWSLHEGDPTLSKAKCVRMAGGCRETFDKWLDKNGKDSWRPVKNAEC